MDAGTAAWTDQGSAATFIFGDEALRPPSGRRRLDGNGSAAISADDSVERGRGEEEELTLGMKSAEASREWGTPCFNLNPALSCALYSHMMKCKVIVTGHKTGD